MEMIVDKSTETNITGSTEFKISSNSAKLFSLLGSFLYSNKELSVLHELSSNAVDAHKMVGKQHLPIEVHLPTALSPNLIVRDFGPGLSPENVVRFLTTYGESDKTASNDFIGGYGIGSKSPAAVTDTWQVTSKHDGKLHQYLIVVNNQGIPALTKLREAKTDETGLEVVIPVNPSTINDWARSARTAFEFYDVHPTIKGQNFIIPNRHDVIKDHPKFKITKTNSYGANFVVISGNRGYQIDVEKLRTQINQDYIQFFRNSYERVLLPFGIGELEVDLSREKLRYSQHTNDAIVKRVNYLGDTIKGELLNELKNVSHLDYLIITAKYYELYGTSVFEMIKGNQYNVKYSGDLHFLKFKHPTPSHFKVAIRGKVSELSVRYSCGKTNVVGYNHDGELTIRLSHFDKIKFVVNDDKSTLNRVRKLTVDSDTICVISDTFDALGKDIEKRAVKGSSLPEVPATVRGPKRAVIKSTLYSKHGRRFLKIKENDAKVFSGEIYWTTITSATSADSDINLKQTKFLEKFLNARVRIVAVKKGETSPTWCKCVTEVYDDIVKKYTSEVSSYKENKEYIALAEETFYRGVTSLKTALPDTSPLKAFLNKVESWVKLDESMSGLPNYKFNLLSNHVDLTTFTYSDTMKEIISMFKHVRQLYPMIELMTNNRYIMKLSGEEVQKCVCYVNLVDDHFEEK